MQGPSKNTVLLEWDKLWNVNKKVIDPIAPRLTALLAENACVVKIVDYEGEDVTKSLLKHKKNESVGVKDVLFANEILIEQSDAQEIENGEEVTFMDWGNMIVVSKNVSASGIVTSITAKLNLQGDVKKTKKKMTWIANRPQNICPVTCHEYDFLITKKKLEEDDSIEDCINPKTEYVSACIGDANLALLKKGDIIQIERKGFFICDAVKDADALSSVHLIAIPDGKAKGPKEIK